MLSLHKSNIVRLLDIRPERVVVFKGRRYISFSLITANAFERFSKHKSMKLQMAFPNSKSPSIYDIILQNTSIEGIKDKNENSESFSARSHLKSLYRVHTSKKWYSSSK